MIEAISAGVALLDPAGVIAGWNTAASETTGIEAADALGRPLQWLYDFLEPQRDAQTTLSAARTGEEIAYEGRLVRHPGRHPWLHATLQRVVGADGECAGFAETWRDASQAGGAHARLLEAERLARLGSWEWDVARDHISWSDGLYAIYGLEPHEFDARYAAREQRVHPDDQARVTQAINRALETASDVDMDYRIIRSDGRVRVLHGRAEVIVDSNGTPIRLFGTAQDVTELRAAEEALEETAIELGRRAAELHRVSHGDPDAAGVKAVLSPRQLEILGLVAEGMTNFEISERLFLTESTVKWHLRQILTKLGVSNRAQAVARYLAASE